MSNNNDFHISPDTCIFPIFILLHAEELYKTDAFTHLQNCNRTVTMLSVFCTVIQWSSCRLSYPVSSRSAGKPCSPSTGCHLTKHPWPKESQPNRQTEIKADKYPFNYFEPLSRTHSPIRVFQNTIEYNLSIPFIHFIYTIYFLKVITVVCFIVYFI